MTDMYDGFEDSDSMEVSTLCGIAREWPESLQRTQRNLRFVEKADSFFMSFLLLLVGTMNDNMSVLLSPAKTRR